MERYLKSEVSNLYPFHRVHVKKVTLGMIEWCDSYIPLDNPNCWYYCAYLVKDGINVEFGFDSEESAVMFSLLFGNQ